MTLKLPSPLARMTPSRKAEVVRAVRRGQIARAEALSTYDLSLEELDEWERLYLAHGERGLRVTRLHEVRHA